MQEHVIEERVYGLGSDAPDLGQTLASKCDGVGLVKPKHLGESGCQHKHSAYYKDSDSRFSCAGS